LANLKKMNSDITKTVWNLPTLEAKKNAILEYIGESCNTKEQEKIRIQLARTKSKDKIDMIVANMFLKSEDCGVI